MVNEVNTDNYPPPSPSLEPLPVAACPRLAAVGRSSRPSPRNSGGHSRFPSRRAIDKCETLAKELYSMIGLQYRESSSEDEAPAAAEVIEIPDEEDDDVMSVDSGWKRSSVSPAVPREGWG